MPSMGKNVFLHLMQFAFDQSSLLQIDPAIDAIDVAVDGMT